MNNSKKSEQDSYAKVKNICCEVKNCTFNENECRCTAEKVNIGPDCATCSPETVCSTFKPKAEKK